ncbi:conserved hypothetical protein [Neospora caninum Liverpool]|uniref:Uncharacterized protein n=1 Tax=Neospora caninum (strain Liverpool) TaxID=572307 RepID=F0VBN2_NEOCL|nr:conserved hypothetical protein [Neospora caninum Liverpool]CBZ51016.1 conserved hypothetical protein [Neospora caninum Liverpool]CEL68321.1 TPA: hypothetical protein BN1204_040910 [Neospora caninum Liverpool]|eukprot:XP_003881049.1 conserved hypothetical protein [Neospora caninum Liverpool]
MPRASLRNRRKNAVQSSVSSSPEGREGTSQPSAPGPPSAPPSSSPSLASSSSSSSSERPRKNPVGLSRFELSTAAESSPREATARETPPFSEPLRRAHPSSQPSSLASVSSASSASSCFSSVPISLSGSSGSCLPLLSSSQFDGNACLSEARGSAPSPFASPVRGNGAKERPPVPLAALLSPSRRLDVPHRESWPASVGRACRERLLSCVPRSLSSRAVANEVACQDAGARADDGRGEKRSQTSLPSSPVLRASFSSPAPFPQTSMDPCALPCGPSSLRARERQWSRALSDGVGGGPDDQSLFSSISSVLVPLCPSRYRTPRAPFEEERDAEHLARLTLPPSFAASPQRRERDYLSLRIQRASESLSRKRLAFSSPESGGSAGPGCPLGKEEKRSFLSPVFAPRPFEKEMEERAKKEGLSGRERRSGADGKPPGTSMSPLLFYSASNPKAAVETMVQREREPQAEKSLERGRSPGSRAPKVSWLFHRRGEREAESRTQLGEEEKENNRQEEGEENPEKDREEGGGKKSREGAQQADARENEGRGTPKRRKPLEFGDTRGQAGAEGRKATLQERRPTGAFASAKDVDERDAEHLTSPKPRARLGDRANEAACFDAVTDLWERGLLSPKAPRDRSLGYVSSPRKSCPSSPVFPVKVAGEERAAGTACCERGPREEERKEADESEDASRSEAKRVSSDKDEIYIVDRQALKWMAPFCTDEEHVLTRARRRRSSVTVLHRLQEHGRGVASLSALSSQALASQAVSSQTICFSGVSRGRGRRRRSSSRSVSADGQAEETRGDASAEREKATPEERVQTGRERRRPSNDLQVDRGERSRRGRVLERESGRREDKQDRDPPEGGRADAVQSGRGLLGPTRSSSVSCAFASSGSASSASLKSDAKKPRASESRVSSRLTCVSSLSPLRPELASPRRSPTRRASCSSESSLSLSFPLSCAPALARASPPRVSGAWSVPLAEVMSPSSPPRVPGAFRSPCPVLSPPPSLSSCSSPRSASREKERVERTPEPATPFGSPSTLPLRRSPRLFASSSQLPFQSPSSPSPQAAASPRRASLLGAQRPAGSAASVSTSPRPTPGRAIVSSSPKKEEAAAAPAHEKTQTARVQGTEASRGRALPKKRPCGGGSKTKGKEGSRGKEKTKDQTKETEPNNASVSSCSSFRSALSGSPQTDTGEKENRATKKLRTVLSPATATASPCQDRSSVSGRRPAPKRHAGMPLSAVSPADSVPPRALRSAHLQARRHDRNPSSSRFSRPLATRVRAGAANSTRGKEGLSGRGAKEGGQQSVSVRHPVSRSSEGDKAQIEGGDRVTGEEECLSNGEAEEEPAAKEKPAETPPAGQSLPSAAESRDTSLSSCDAVSGIGEKENATGSEGQAPREEGREVGKKQAPAVRSERSRGVSGTHAAAEAKEEEKGEGLENAAVGERKSPKQEKESSAVSAPRGSSESERGGPSPRQPRRPLTASTLSSLGLLSGVSCFASPFRRRASSDASTERSFLSASPASHLSASRPRASSEASLDARSVSARSSCLSSAPSLLRSPRFSASSAASAHAGQGGAAGGSRETPVVFEWEKKRAEEEAKHARDLQQALDDDLEAQVERMRQSRGAGGRVGGSDGPEGDDASRKERKRKRDDSDDAEIASRRADLSMDTPSFLALDPFLVDEADEKLLTTQQLRTYLSTIITGDLHGKSREALLYMAKAWSLQTHTSTGVPSSRMNFANVGERFVPQAARRFQGKVLPKERRRHSILRSSSSALLDGRQGDNQERLKRRRISFSPFNKVQLYTLDETERQSKEEAAQRSFQNEQQQLMILERQRENALASFSPFSSSSSRFDVYAESDEGTTERQDEDEEKENQGGNDAAAQAFCPFPQSAEFSTPPPPAQKPHAASWGVSASTPPYSSGISGDFFSFSSRQEAPLAGPRLGDAPSPGASLSHPLNSPGKSKQPMPPGVKDSGKVDWRRNEDSPFSSAVATQSKLPFTTSPSFKLLHGSDPSAVSGGSATSLASSVSPCASSCPGAFSRHERSSVFGKPTFPSRGVVSTVPSFKAFRDAHLRNQQQAPSVRMQKPSASAASSPFAGLGGLGASPGRVETKAISEKRNGRESSLQTQASRAASSALAGGGRLSAFSGSHLPKAAGNEKGGCTYTGSENVDGDENRENGMVNGSRNKALEQTDAGVGRASEKGGERNGFDKLAGTDHGSVRRGNEAPVQFYISPLGQRVYRRGSLVSPAAVSGFQGF